MKKLLIVTDLDASFIDDNYQYSEATEAIRQLKAQGYPLVFNSSKTLLEIQSLAQELELTTPLIAENGGIVAVPEMSEVANYCEAEGWQHESGYHTLITGLSLDYILKHAHTARTENDYLFSGFSDMTEQEISSITGLTQTEAYLAKQRHVSEPILWQDSDQRWEQFSSFLHSKGIRTLRGGRFIHLMGPADKADGLNVTHQLYQQCYPEIKWTTVALGDSANDQSMLEDADIAIAIPHSDGFHIDAKSKHIIQAQYPASRGWNDSILKLLSTT